MKRPFCSRCRKPLSGLVPGDAEQIICFACDNPLRWDTPVHHRSRDVQVADTDAGRYKCERSRHSGFNAMLQPRRAPGQTHLAAPVKVGSPAHPSMDAAKLACVEHHRRHHEHAPRD